MYAKPDQVLAQQSQFLLAVNNSILDAGGNAVQSPASFKDCSSEGAYCSALDNAISKLPSGVQSNIVSASLFTTMTARDWVSKAYNYVQSANLPRSPNPAQYSLSQFSAMSWTPDLGTGQRKVPQSIPLGILSNVDSVAFGSYYSPMFITQTGTIPVTPTGSPITPPAGPVQVSYHLLLPSSTLMPPGGFPVAIFGHGLGDAQFGASTFIANTLASYGVATLAIEVFGHGYGPGGSVTLTRKNGKTQVVVSTPGRAVLYENPIGPSDGCIAPGPIGVRDCAKQTAVDLFSLVKTIQSTNGLGMNINPQRIYFVGQSFGAMYGTLFHATDPAIKAAVLNVGGGTSVDVSRLTFLGRPLAEAYLGSLGLLNVPPASPEMYFRDLPDQYPFNDLYVFRDTPVQLNYASNPAAQSVVNVDDALEIADWLNMDGDPLAFASKLANQPLPGVLGKSTLIQFAYGDLEVPNPTNSALIRTAGLQSQSWYFRFDLAWPQNPDLLSITFDAGGFPRYPHAFLANPTLFSGEAYEDSIAVAAQTQVALYLQLGGIYTPNPNLFLTGPFAGQKLFEIPSALPEQLNFVQFTP